MAVTACCRLEWRPRCEPRSYCPEWVETAIDGWRQGGKPTVPTSMHYAVLLRLGQPLSDSLNHFYSSFHLSGAAIHNLSGVGLSDGSLLSQHLRFKLSCVQPSVDATKVICDLHGFTAK